MALVGGITAMLGVGIVVWGASALGAMRTSGRTESLLAPTLAVDTLDDDLRVVYMRTLVLDARCQARYGREQQARWGEIGRELRRLLVLEQAIRTAGCEPSDAQTFGALVDKALDHVLSGEPLGEQWSRDVDAILRQRKQRAAWIAQPAEERSNSL